MASLRSFQKFVSKFLVSKTKLSVEAKNFKTLKSVAFKNALKSQSKSLILKQNLKPTNSYSLPLNNALISVSKCQNYSENLKNFGLKCWHKILQGANSKTSINLMRLAFVGVVLSQDSDLHLHNYQAMLDLFQDNEKKVRQDLKTMFGDLEEEEEVVSVEGDNVDCEEKKVEELNKREIETQNTPEIISSEQSSEEIKENKLINELEKNKDKYEEKSLESSYGDDEISDESNLQINDDDFEIFGENSSESNININEQKIKEEKEDGFEIINKSKDYKYFSDESNLQINDDYEIFGENSSESNININEQKIKEEKEDGFEIIIKSKDYKYFCDENSFFDENLNFVFVEENYFKTTDYYHKNNKKNNSYIKNYINNNIENNNNTNNVINIDN